MILDVVDSTNEEARRRHAVGHDGPLWIAARRQSAGRGRRGRPWSTEPGNLAATLLMPFEGTPAEAARLGFPASLAVAGVLAGIVPRARVALKWPNDVLLNGRKASGILLENLGAASAGRLIVAIGVGINLAHHPAAEAEHWPATSVAREGGVVPTFEDALARLDHHMTHWLSVLQDQGFAAVRSAWLSRADKLGQTIQARLARDTITGRFSAIDAEGALVLDTADGRHRIAAGDIFFQGNG